MTIQDIVNYTNIRIESWYMNALLDHDVVGEGKAFYDENTDTIIVSYIEDGVSKTWEMAFYPEYISNGLDWVYNCWSELA